MLYIDGGGDLRAMILGIYAIISLFIYRIFDFYPSGTKIKNEWGY